MASVKMAPSLPSKKRKHSFGSDVQSSSSDPVRIRKDSTISEQQENPEKQSTKNQPQHAPSARIAENRLPSKKRKGSYDSVAFSTTSDFARKRNRKGSVDHSVTFEDLERTRKHSLDASLGVPDSPRKLSNDGKVLETYAEFAGSKEMRSLSTDASTNDPPKMDIKKELEVLKEKQERDATEKFSKPPPDRKRKLSESDSKDEKPRSCSTIVAAEPKTLAELNEQLRKTDDHSTSSTTTSGQRLLFEAIMMKEGDYEQRSRKGSMGGKSSKEETTNRSRLDSFACSLPSVTRERINSIAQSGPNSDDLPAGRDRLDSWGAWKGARDRLESWGGMSDLSGHLAMEPPSGAIFPTHSGEDSKPSEIPTRISLGRTRLSSLASFSEVSATNLPFTFGEEGADPVGDMQAYVAAAMASVSDQIADLAGVVENVASASVTGDLRSVTGEFIETKSTASSVATPLLGAASEAQKEPSRPRALSNCSALSGISALSVDYEAVQAAITAAEAVTVDYSDGGDDSVDHSLSSRVVNRHRRLPLRSRADSILSLNSVDLSDSEKERIRERAQSAVEGKPKKKNGPIKKRSKRTPEKVNANDETPRRSNKAQSVPQAVGSSQEAAGRNSARGQASVKWENMYTCLLEFIEERKDVETKGQSQEEKDAWIWDGNVPTNFKTLDGKALGRWVNNQRSAKSKGTLKDDREERLYDAGLKWSVMAGNSWNEMLKELSIYIKDQTKDGGTWDGNVPTTYQIKTAEDSAFAGEDKNLGRWVNRQRSLFQSGKLRKDRKEALDKIGLKWSMLATTTWDSMCETLCEYVKEQEKAHGKWDGNVPANFKTNHAPPRALGRWINRQRSAYMKNKLKKEYVDRLNQIGLKWSVHHRQEVARTDVKVEEKETPQDVPSSSSAGATL